MCRCAEASTVVCPALPCPTKGRVRASGDSEPPIVVGWADRGRCMFSASEAALMGAFRRIIDATSAVPCVSMLKQEKNADDSLPSLRCCCQQSKKRERAAESCPATHHSTRHSRSTSAVVWVGAFAFFLLASPPNASKSVAAAGNIIELHFHDKLPSLLLIYAFHLDIITPSHHHGQTRQALPSSVSASHGRRSDGVFGRLQLLGRRHRAANESAGGTVHHPPTTDLSAPHGQARCSQPSPGE